MIYFKDGEKAKNISELISIGYSRGSNRFKETFFDKKLTKEECHEARRSFTALLEICQTYFPNTTAGELANELIKNKGSNLRAFVCPGIDKLVFVCDNDNGCTRFDKIEKNSDYKGLDGISYDDVLALKEEFIKNNSI